MYVSPVLQVGTSQHQTPVQSYALPEPIIPTTIFVLLVQPTVLLVSEVAVLSVSPVQLATSTLSQTVLSAKNAAVTVLAHASTVLAICTAPPVRQTDTSLQPTLAQLTAHRPPFSSMTTLALPATLAVPLALGQPLPPVSLALRAPLPSRALNVSFALLLAQAAQPTTCALLAPLADI